MWSLAKLRTAALFTVATAATLSAAWALAPDADADAAEVPASVPPAVDGPIAEALIRCGLDGEALAAAGVSSTATTSAVNALATAFNSDPTALAGHDSGYADAKRSCDALARTVRSGRGTATDVASLRTAELTLANCESQRQAYLDGMFNAGIAPLTASEQATLQTIRDNRWWELPVHYLVLDRTEADWVELRDVIDAHEINVKYGEPLDTDAQTYLAAVDATTEIAAAKTSYDAYLAAVQTAWNAAADD